MSASRLQNGGFNCSFQRAPYDLAEDSFKRIHSKSDGRSSPFIQGPSIQRQILNGIKEASNDPDILYMAELRKRPNSEKVNDKITTDVQRHGFKRPTNEEYIYNGDNPAAALRALSQIKPLILDCGTALHLKTFQALASALGDAQFNTYIKETCDGVLSIDKQKAPPIPSKQTAYYSARHEQKENKLPNKLQNGDRLWIQGPAHGYAFHPASEVNGFNVLADVSNPQNPALVGFVSSSTATHGTWNYEGLRALLLKEYQAPLTLRDFSTLRMQAEAQQKKTGARKNIDYAPYSSWSAPKALDWLAKTQPEAMKSAQHMLRSANDLDQPTQLLPPSADSIRGVMQHSRMDDGLSLHALIHYPNKLGTVALNPQIPADRSFSDLIPGFETRLPHQRQIAAAMEDFYTACTKQDSSNDQPFRGAILYGNAGTGKTMACNAVLGRLEKEGHAIWKTDFHTGQALLSLEEEQHLLTILQTGGSDAVQAELTKKFKPEWDKNDIIFVDDTNNKHDTLAEVSNAALRYAKETGKKMLITCNSDPIHAFNKSIEFPVDWVSIRHIAGPDYRAEHAWYHQAAPEKFSTPEKIQKRKVLGSARLARATQKISIAGKSKSDASGKIVPRETLLQANQTLSSLKPTSNQKQMIQSLHALEAAPGHNGVAFYGPPGIGKTTVLKDFFDKSERTPLWIESHTLIDKIDLVKELAKSDASYLVIDDCNDPNSNHNYGNVLFSLLNNEELYNKSGEPVRTVMVSNRSSWKELVDDTASGQNALSPRMNSRYAGRFMSIALAPDQDFRANGPKRGTIVKPDSVVISDNAYRLSISQFIKDRSGKMNELDVYERDMISYDKHGNATYLPVAGHMRDAYDSKYAEWRSIETNALKGIEGASEILLDMRNCDADPRYRDLIKQVLDVMDAKPDYKVTVVSDDPQKTMDILKDMTADVDKTGKYTSRLARIGVE